MSVGLPQILLMTRWIVVLPVPDSFSVKEKIKPFWLVNLSSGAPSPTKNIKARASCPGRLYALATRFHSSSVPLGLNQDTKDKVVFEGGEYTMPVAEISLSPTMNLVSLSHQPNWVRIFSVVSRSCNSFANAVI